MCRLKNIGTLRLNVLGSSASASASAKGGLEETLADRTRSHFLGNVGKRLGICRKTGCAVCERSDW